MALLPLRVRRESDNNPFKDRLRRSLLVAVISITLILVCLYYSDDSSLTPYVPSVLTRKNRRGMLVSSTGPRALIFITSDKIDETLCYSAGSAHLTGMSVVVAGYQMPFNGAMSKLDFMERAIKNTGLKPSDVVIVVDSDTIFTGADLNPFLDRFIARSAPTPELRCVCVWKRE
ncbi:unnamed protein product [Phytomonas sp. EM1]|nr:unnamed protein product [Phytomonas sp. EM1]|eukprot:CCW65456.1 unnamed protein product [Phytomonas sp. isolate EM1]